jgi:hypothetical protein
MRIRRQPTAERRGRKSSERVDEKLHERGRGEGSSVSSWSDVRLFALGIDSERRGGW